MSDPGPSGPSCFLINFITVCLKFRNLCLKKCFQKKAFFSYFTAPFSDAAVLRRCQERFGGVLALKLSPSDYSQGNDVGG